MQSHFVRAHAEAPPSPTCSQCNREFGTLAALRTHATRSHGPANPDSGPPQGKLCDCCQTTPIPPTQRLPANSKHWRCDRCRAGCPSPLRAGNCRQGGTVERDEGATGDPHVHRWVMDAPNGPVIHGRCACGAERDDPAAPEMHFNLTRDGEVPRR